MCRRGLLLLVLSFAGPASAADCPANLRLAGNRLFLPLTVNGHETEALLDSGAELTLVDAALATQLGLVTAGEETVKGTGGSEAVRFAEGVSIEAAGSSLRAVTVAVLDLSGLSERLVGEPVRVILGRELFDLGRWFLDVNAGHLCRVTDAVEPTGMRLPLAEHAGIMQFPVTVEDGATVYADFDLGNGSEMLIGRTFALQHGLLAPGRVTGTKAGGGIGGPVARDLVVLERLDVAGVDFDDVPAAIDATDNAADVNVGVAILRHFTMTIDFPGRALWLAPAR